MLFFDFAKLSIYFALSPMFAFPKQNMGLSLFFKLKKMDISFIVVAL